MAAFKPAQCVALFICLWISSVAVEALTVRPRADIILQCQARQLDSIKMVKWLRPDLKTDGYVFFFRDGSPLKSYQLLSFRGRVELRDPEMKDGNASVILKNVQRTDTGTYECHIGGTRRGQPKKVQCHIKVTVADSVGHFEGDGDTYGRDKSDVKTNVEENKNGFIGLVVGLSVFGVILLVGVAAAVIVVIFIRKRNGKNNPYRPAEKRFLDELKINTKLVGGH